MTGNEDGNRIAAIRQADGTRSIRIVQSLGELSVAARLAERNFCQFAPDALLEPGALHAQWQIEFATLAREIFFQLARGGRQRVDGGILNPVIAQAWQLAWLVAIQIHVQTREGGAVRSEHQSSDGTVDITKNIHCAAPSDCHK